MNQDNKFIRSLIHGSLRGNNSALEQLFDMNLGKVYALVLRLVVDQKIANELTKSILVDAWKKLASIREDASFSTWLTGIAVYKSLDFLRTNKLSELIDKARLPSKDPFERNILSLPRNNRLVIVLHHFEKYSIEEIADLLMVSKTEVTKRLLDGEAEIINKCPNADTKELLIEKIGKLQMEIQPKKDIMLKAFDVIYEIKKIENAALNQDSKNEASEDNDKSKSKGGFLKNLFTKK